MESKVVLFSVLVICSDIVASLPQFNGDYRHRVYQPGPHLGPPPFALQEHSGPYEIQQRRTHPFVNEIHPVNGEAFHPLPHQRPPFGIPLREINANDESLSQSFVSTNNDHRQGSHPQPYRSATAFASAQAHVPRYPGPPPMERVHNGPFYLGPPVNNFRRQQPPIPEFAITPNDKGYSFITYQPVNGDETQNNGFYAIAPDGTYEYVDDVEKFLLDHPELIKLLEDEYQDETTINKTESLFNQITTKAPASIVTENESSRDFQLRNVNENEETMTEEEKEAYIEKYFQPENILPIQSTTSQNIVFTTETPDNSYNINTSTIKDSDKITTNTDSTDSTTGHTNTSPDIFIATQPDEKTTTEVTTVAYTAQTEAPTETTQTLVTDQVTTQQSTTVENCDTTQTTPVPVTTTTPTNQYTTDFDTNTSRNTVTTYQTEEDRTTTPDTQEITTTVITTTTIQPTVDLSGTTSSTTEVDKTTTEPTLDEANQNTVYDTTTQRVEPSTTTKDVTTSAPEDSENYIQETTTSKPEISVVTTTESNAEIKSAEISDEDNETGTNNENTLSPSNSYIHDSHEYEENMDNEKDKFNIRIQKNRDCKHEKYKVTMFLDTRHNKTVPEKEETLLFPPAFPEESNSANNGQCANACKAPLIERLVKEYVFENGTIISETVETIWERVGDKLPKEIKTYRLVKNPED